DREAPVFEADHAVGEELADGGDAFDPSEGGIDVHHVVGEEVGQVDPRCVTGLDALAHSDVGGNGGLDLAAVEHQTPATRPYSVGSTLPNMIVTFERSPTACATR